MAWRPVGFQPAGVGSGLSQTFSDQYASYVRGWDDLTFGCGQGFLAPVFLSLVVSIQVRQSATPSQIVREKTLRQTRSDRQSKTLVTLTRPLAAIQHRSQRYSPYLGKL